MSDDLDPKQIPPAMIFVIDGDDHYREVHGAKRYHARCPRCHHTAEIWEMLLLPLNQHPNHARIHRGENSCGIMLDTIQADIGAGTGWVIINSGGVSTADKGGSSTTPP